MVYKKNNKDIQRSYNYINSLKETLQKETIKNNNILIAKYRVIKSQDYISGGEYLEYIWKTPRNNK